MYNNSTNFFLGSNSSSGFYSLYNDFTDPSIDTLYILKGGPGCGKSTFMKKLAEKAEEKGHGVEYIHCSGDPNSLDAIYIKDLRLGFVDGTAPHDDVPILHNFLFTFMY